MPKNSPIPVPDPDALLNWAVDNPDAAKKLVETVNLLRALQVKLIRAGVFSFNQQVSLLISDENVILNLPLFWPAGVPSNVATYSDTAGVAYSQTKMQSLMDQVTALTTALNLVLAGERSVQNLPGAAT